MSEAPGPRDADREGARPAERFALAVRGLGLAATRYRTVTLRTRGRVGFTDGAALGRLYVDGPHTPSELAVALDLTTAATTSLLDRLEAAGHVVRTPHPRDRRRIVVTLTEAADRLLATEVLEPMVRTLGQVLDGYPPEVRPMLIDALHESARALARHTDEVDGRGS